jgi:hypothetical protein
MTDAVRKSISDADLIAERELQIVDLAGRTGPLHVRIARPEWREGDGAWACGVHFPEVEDRVSEMWGEDSFQALVHALYIVPVVVGQLRAQGLSVTFEGRDELLLPSFDLPGASIG